MAVNDFAVIGLNNIGRGIALNMKNRQYSVAIYDEDFEHAQKFSDECNAKAKAYREIKSLISSLSVPRKIFICTDTRKTDEIILLMMSQLSKADTIIDMSESSSLEAKKRAELLDEKSLRYLDAAVTGIHSEISSGVGLIVGGSEDAFSACARILRQLSKEHKGFSSCINSGAFGTGFYTKMVHDTIEASLMQVIADGYFVLRSLGGMKCEEISAAFTFINEELNLYLLKITADILEQYDQESEEPIIDFVIDSVSVEQNAKTPNLLGVQAILLRHLSGQREKRRALTKKLYAHSIRYESGNIELLDSVKDAMKASMTIAYAQGFDLLSEAIKSGEWSYGEDEVARVWNGSSTINSEYLVRAHIAFNNSENLMSLLADDYFTNRLKSFQKGFRETVMLAAKHGIPAPSFMSALSYYDSMRTKILPANLIQSQLNYMRRDTVRRYDIQGNFNVDWVVDDKKDNKKDPH